MVKCPMDTVTAFTQLRTDTTLDLSQQAEKVQTPTAPYTFITPTIIPTKGPIHSRINHLNINNFKLNSSECLYLTANTQLIFTSTLNNSLLSFDKIILNIVPHYLKSIFLIILIFKAINFLIIFVIVLLLFYYYHLLI